MKPNTFNEKLFVDAIRNNKIAISESGVMTNTKSGKPMGYINNTGYIATAMKINGRTIHVLVHRIVYLIHVGTISEDKVINHIDGNKLNNNVNNLEQITMRDNNIHAIRTKLRTTYSNSGSRNRKALLTDEQVIEVRNMYATGSYTQKEIADVYGTARTTMNQIITAKHYKV